MRKEINMSYEYRKRLTEFPDSQNRNSDIHTKTLFGQTIHENPVPVWTADRAHNPFVAFQDPESQKIVGISKELLSYGFLALGVPGSGKTNFYNMILSRLLETQSDQEIILIFDTKGDYLKEFGGRIPMSDRIIIGAGEEYRGITGFHNIFSEIMPRGNDEKLVYTPDSDTDALDIATQLFQKMGSDVQPVFPAMSEQIFAGVLIYFMRTFWRSDQKKLNNKELIQFLSKSTNEDLKAIFELEYMEDQRCCINYISNKGNQTQGVNSYIGSVLKKMFIGPFAESNPAREFSMQSVIRSRRKKVMFIEYDMKRGQALAPMYGILIDRALANALGGRQSDRNNVYIILDEMLLLPSLLHLSDGLNFGRSQGVRILCGLQNISGVSNLYGEAEAKNVLASFQNIITFRLTDFDTRQFVINRLGENYQNLSFVAEQKNIHTQREGHTVEDWDLIGLKLGEAVMSLKDERPFLFSMPKY